MIHIPYTLNRAGVEDRAKWKSAFAAPAGKAARKAVGAKSWQVFRSNDYPNDIVVLVEWDNVDNGRKYYHNKEFLGRQPAIGVLGLWTEYFEEVEKGSV